MFRLFASARWTPFTAGLPGLYRRWTRGANADPGRGYAPRLYLCGEQLLGSTRLRAHQVGPQRIGGPFGLPDFGRRDLGAAAGGLDGGRGAGSLAIGANLHRHLQPVDFRRQRAHQLARAHRLPSTQ